MNEDGSRAPLQGLSEHETAVPPVSVQVAWRRYLEEMRSATPEAYELIEAIAWQRLTSELNKASRRLRFGVEEP